MSSSNVDLDSEILEAAVAPDQATLSPRIARALVGVNFTQRQQAEVQRLLDKNNAGTLTPAQRKRLESYVRVGNFLSLLKVKARLSLDQRTQKK